MRKIIIIGLTFLLIVSSSLAAYTYPDFFREDISFAPTSTRIEGWEELVYQLQQDSIHFI